MSEEQKEFAQKTEEVLRTEAVETLRGDSEEFDEEANAGLIDRLTAKLAKEEEIKVSLHSQKTKRGEAIKTLESELATLKSKPADQKTLLDEQQLTEKFKELKDEDFLEESGYTDSIKNEIKVLAKVKNCSAKKAEQEPYIQSLVKTEKEKNEVLDASINNNNKARARIDVSSKKASDFDMKTKEGREAWEKLTPEQKMKISKNG